MIAGSHKAAGRIGGRSSVLALAALAAVHAHLVSSSPEDGEALSESPAVIRLVFSEPVEAGLSHIVVWSALDSLEIRVRADSTDSRILLGDVPRLAPAEYQVDWRVVSADGHPVEGSYRFTVLAPAGTPDTFPTLGPPAAHGPGMAGHAHATGPTLAAGVSAILRGLALFMLVALAGWLVQIVALGGVPPRGAMRTALLLATLATAFLGAHFAAWLWHVTPGGRTPDVAAALGTGPGRVEALRVGLAFLALWAVGLARRPWIALTLALAAVLVSGATGHSAGISPRWSIPLKSLHLIAIAVWVGGVAWLAVAALDPAAFGASAQRVSGMALGAVIVVGLTGVAQSALFLPNVSALLGSAYGRLVLAKVAGLAGLVAFGAWNRQRLMPRLDEGAGQAALRASTRRELALMLAVSLVAGILAYVPPPSS
ncbi:MAG TPA: copper resistance protein CopC [Gemmatimonadota bacterium]|nr:copper resistance protein CopC [Gemmatimonadota bacterium]